MLKHIVFYLNENKPKRGLGWFSEKKANGVSGFALHDDYSLILDYSNLTFAEKLS